MKVQSTTELLQNNLLVKHLAGSHAYGTSLLTSDTDYRGLFCADPVNVRTPFFPVREVEDTDEEDTKFYELAHFMKLCLDCNPNVVETLWVADEDVVFRTPAYDHLRAHREKLLSSKVAFTFSGYALSQLKRIKGHNKWINNPQPEQPPKPYEFLSMVQWFGAEKNLKPSFDEYRNNHRLVPYGGDTYGVCSEPGHQLWDNTGNLNTNFNGDRQAFSVPLMVVKWNREEYRTVKELHDKYWTWKRNRNEKRSELEEHFGYDTKHAMHLVRLLRMGVEILRDGQVLVKRADADELLAIRAGEWTYDQIAQYAETMDKEVREVWYKKTSLPKYPDVKLAAQLLMEVQDMVWK
jgi:uncharacterized protein